MRERLPEYADGSLRGLRRTRLERHLRRCPRCNAELEELRTVLSAVRSVTPDEIPEGLLTRIRQAIPERAPSTPSFALTWARIALPAAAAIALVAVSFALFSPERKMAAQRKTGPLFSAQGAAEESAPDQSLVIARRKQEAPAEALAGQHLRRGSGPALAPDASDAARPSPEVEARADLEAMPAQPPGPAGPLGPPQERRAFKVGESGGGFGGGGAAGGAARGGAPRAPARSGTPHLGDAAEEAAPPRLAEVAPPPSPPAGTQDTRVFYDTAAEPPSQQPPPPFSATVTQSQHGGRQLIALQLNADHALLELSVYLGESSARDLLWRGACPAGASIPLSSDQLGSTPASTPISVESAAGRRDYLLFTPTLSRLGQTAPTAPTGPYRGESLRDTLAEFSSLTGLVVLAERPLSQTMSGARPAGPPDAALQEIAARAAMKIKRGGDVVFTLTHTR